MAYLPRLKICIMLIYLLFVSGCAMQTSVEVSGGFFDGELQEEY